MRKLMTLAGLWSGHRLLYTSFSCWYPQKAGFAGPARGSRQRLHASPARSDFFGHAYTPANETVDLLSGNMAAPV